MSDSIVDRLRNYDTCHDGDVDIAADLLEFFLSQMQATSVYMNGQHVWRLRSSGWPMTHCVGPTAEQAALNAVAEIRRERAG